MAIPGFFVGFLFFAVDKKYDKAFQTNFQGIYLRTDTALWSRCVNFRVCDTIRGKTKMLDFRLCRI